MRHGTFGFVRLLGTVLAIFVPYVASAQRTFTYAATDIRTVVITDRVPVSIPVTTVIIISGGAAPDFGAQGPTDPFSVTLRPPPGEGPQIVQAMVNGRLIRLDIIRTTADGEYLAVANIPKSAPELGLVQVLWTTRDKGYIQTSVTGDLLETKPSIPLVQHVFTIRKGH